jgi:hypothetical protein
MAKWIGLLEPNCEHFCTWCDIGRKHIIDEFQNGKKAVDRAFDNWQIGSNGIKVSQLFWYI